MKEPTTKTQLYILPSRPRPLSEEELRARFTKEQAEWSEQWGGKPPYILSEDQKQIIAKRNIAQQEQRPWRKAFNGVGVVIFLLAYLLVSLLVFVQLGRIVGW